MESSIKGFKRTHMCGDFSAANEGQAAAVCGWVQRRRDLGGLVFLTVRDRTGIVQCVFSETENKELFDRALALRAEFTVAVEGRVALRAPGMANPEMKTGEIEILASSLRVFSKAETPPFEIVEKSDVNDMLRLKYRYLDLRRPDMQKNIILRHKIMQATRRFFDANGFLEIETPILTKSTPEGARDYLVPSRVHPGKFFALPQSPQQYKQLLMLAGFDRYFQITRCMRDEDLRADRQPEFTQVDLEMSFVDRDDVMDITEKYMQSLFEEVLGVAVALPMRRMGFDEAMRRFGSDKPDTRFGYELVDISDVAPGCGFGVFENAVSSGGLVNAVKIDGGAAFSRKEIDSLAEFVKTYRAGGLAWMKLAGGQVQASFAKFVTQETIDRIVTATGAADGDIILIVADAKADTVYNSLGALRCECARRTGVIDPGAFNFLWVTDFPLYEFDEEENRFAARHHPFTAPFDEDADILESDPGAVRAKAYDMVLNGYELGGGSIRIHESGLQRRMFKVLGFSEEELSARFGHLIEAFKYGAPPHGGLAFGLDRIAMLMSGSTNLRDVIAFPKVQNASELMMSSPDYVDDGQLEELGIALTVKKEE